MLVLNIKMLYYYGKMPENVVFESGDRKDYSLRKRPKVVAIVGSRKNTNYGYEVAYKAAYAAAKAGAVVVSGLAYGIDSIAHRGALDAGGITLAVLGTPINEIYPRTHVGLAREIVEKGGAVISEYGPGEVVNSRGEIAARFLWRNRIIAALSDVVLVAEAADRSGSLNTATHALNYGVDLMVAPGDITRLSSRGCNKLLAQGAMPYTGTDDLLEVLFPSRRWESGVSMWWKREVSVKPKRGGSNESAKGANKKCDWSGRKGCNQGGNDELERRMTRLANQLETEIEREIVSLLVIGTNEGEEIIEKLKITTMEFAQAMTVLEVKGVVKALGMNKWMLLV